ncbi:Glycosyl transferase family 2 [Methylobacterium sp. 174MFSha1.1]|uniref:glycosyltransferase family 2 protein n=1 Tax=Methylobacterium sp. 174MFSha1.1 TaxID=1502749 RepID=UPI0008EE2209|nr:glycosyltransferase [Methylobacterium sp. 174MFSha1.1]SFU72182.1 Glycosyl transferase family 2 [Methylobacterium sp. 174MFSha1.1]
MTSTKAVATARSGPRVSVVLPLRAGFPVEPALASLRAQTFGDYEVLAVGEGAAEAASLAGDPRVRALRDEESGRCAARNRGVTAARAEWVAFLDPGDAWREDHLAELVAATRFGDAVAVFGNPVLGEGGRPLLPMSVPSGRVSDPFDFALRIGAAPLRASAALIERAAAIDAGLFPTRCGGGPELDLWGRLALQGLFRYVARPTAVLGPAPPSRRVPAPPLLAATLTRLFDEGAVPAELAPSARRCRNRLMLDHARKLADLGRPAEARAVLARDCVPGLDPARYLAVLARIWRAGRAWPAPGALAGSP